MAENVQSMRVVECSVAVPCVCVCAADDVDWCGPHQGEKFYDKWVEGLEEAG